MPGTFCAAAAAIFVAALILGLLYLVGRPPAPFHTRAPGRTPDLHERRARWERVAEAFGMEYLDNRLDNLMQVDDHKLWGTLRGNRVEIQIRHSQFSSDEMGLQGRMSFSRALRGAPIAITPRGLWRLSRRHVVKTGDAEFDARFIVHCPDPEYALRIASSDLREALKVLYDLAPGLAMDNHGLAWSASGRHSGGPPANSVRRACYAEDLDELMGALDAFALALRDAASDAALSDDEQARASVNEPVAAVRQVKRA